MVAADDGALVSHPAMHSLRFYRKAMRTQGRMPLYARLLSVVIDDVDGGGVCAELLADPGPDPIDDAVPLRLLGAVHRLVLSGRATELAPFFPSVGGAYDPATDPDPSPALLSVLLRERAEIARRLQEPVQTNEVSRCRALMLGFLEVVEETGLPLRLLEIGSSGGLNLRWDRYRYTGGVAGSAFGPVHSPVRLSGEYRGEAPNLDRVVVVADRRGCDRSPIDPTTTEGGLTLKSFVWPEQADRLERIDAALELARRVPAPIDRADAAEWIDDQLADGPNSAGLATVVFQSIVWQYLTTRTRGRLLNTFSRVGRSATAAAQLAWLRMEPAGGAVGAPHAEVTLTLWPGGRQRLIAHTGYHGEWVEAVTH